LRVLRLKKWRELADAALASLRYVTELVELDLSRCFTITNQFTTWLPPSLEKLALESDDQLTEGMIPLLPCALQHLDLMHICLQFTSPQLWTSLHQLTSLNLTLCDLNDEGLACVASAQNLRALILSYNQGLTGSGFVWLQKLEQLRTLELAICKRITSFEQMPRRLTKLDLLGVHLCGPDALRWITVLADLETLDLSATDLCDTALERLGELRKLRKLRVSNCRNLTEASVKFIMGRFPSFKVARTRSIHAEINCEFFL
jgi:hypothetical protein